MSPCCCSKHLLIWRQLKMSKSTQVPNKCSEYLGVIYWFVLATWLRWFCWPVSAGFFQSSLSCRTKFEFMQFSQMGNDVHAISKHDWSCGVVQGYKVVKPDLSSEGTTLLSPTILSCNLEIGTEATLDHRYEDKWRWNDSFCKNDHHDIPIHISSYISLRTLSPNKIGWNCELKQMPTKSYNVTVVDD